MISKEKLKECMNGKRLSDSARLLFCYILLVDHEKLDRNELVLNLSWTRRKVDKNLDELCKAGLLLIEMGLKK
jgi:predicted transcriptional regulator